MMSLQSSMHSSQMNTDGPAMSLRTSCWLLPQNEQYNSLSPEFLSAMSCRDRVRGLIPVPRLRACRPLVQDLGDQTVLLGLFVFQEIVTLGIPCDPFNRQSRM